MHTVCVIALPDVITFDLATPIETFGHALLPDGRPAYRVLVCGTAPVVEAGPLRIATDLGLSALAEADTIVVPGRNRPYEASPPEVIEALRAAATDGTRISSICVGAFTLAEAGLLDGKRATTHWTATDELARRYPGVRVDPDRLVVDAGQVLTSAGASAGLDLCLHMIRRDHGAAVAAHVSRLAVAPMYRSGGQAQYMVQNPPTRSTATLDPVLEWIERNAGRDLGLDDLARVGRTSVRTLNRRFHAETGQSPIEWLTRVRVRHAQELLESTDHGVDRVARQVGLPSISNFRAQFRRVAGTTPQEYRRTFRGTAGP